MATYTKISPKMVNPGDIFGNGEEEEVHSSSDTSDFDTVVAMLPYSWCYGINPKT